MVGVFAQNRWVGCTAVYKSELAKAKVLSDSFQRFHPEAGFVVLIIDGRGDAISFGNATVFGLSDLELPRGDEWRLPMLFNYRELRLLLVPLLLDAILRDGAASAAFFSPSTQVFGSIHDIIASCRPGETILATKFIENEFGDLGRSFLSVPTAARAELRSWFARLRKQSASESQTDPANFRRELASISVQEVCEPGFAASYVKLDPVTLNQTTDGYTIQGRPLRSFDFRGYNPEKPHLFSSYLGLEPRILLSQHPALADLCDSYRDSLLRAGHRPASRLPYESLPSGLRLDARILRTYRRALDNNGNEPPSPFGPVGEKGFVDWLNESIDRERIGVTRFMMGVYEDRPDLHAVFPDPLGADAGGLRDWYINFGPRELELPTALVPVQATTTGVSGVNVAGYFRAELGIGTAARALLGALEAADIPVNTITFDQTANRLAHPFSERTLNGTPADINLTCVNPDQIAAFAKQAGPELWNGRYNIGVWFWEVEDFPSSFHYAFNYVDEIWVASAFMREAFLKVSPKPVFKFRLPVLTPQVDPAVSRATFGLPDRFILLFSFDFLSVLERKNPIGLIEAFTRAFADGEGPVLVIKTINGDKRPLAMEKLKYFARGRSDIVLRDGYLSSIENNSFAAQADCYVSLHRSEGFGLTIAEAMALGKPVIASAYSGNLEFMSEDNSYLCPVRRCEVGPEQEPYPANSHWSEPDLEAAATLMRRVFDCPEEAQSRGRRAAEDMRRFGSPATTGAIVRERIATIRRRRAATDVTPTAALLQDRIAELEEENRKLREKFPS